ncbi:MAG TPA: ribonuclease HII [Devosia sp.]|nr:ribonuclease HII [Devosia sp.]
MARDSTDTAAREAAPIPDLRFERRAARRGAKVVAGVDEAGRGPLAGPVVVSAVILNRWSIPEGLNDSKVLTSDFREELFARIMKTATVAICVAPPSTIYTRNILQATLWAMRQAVLSLPLKPDHVLVDGNIVPKELPCGGEAVVGGDGKSVSIAAASIIAKVTRDRMCQIMHREEPHFGFDGHKGYSTPEHLAALQSNGPGRHHRMDFAPCAEAARMRTVVMVEGETVAA